MTAVDERGPGPDETAAERHAWDLGVWWDVYFSAVMAVMVVLALLTTGPAWRWPATGLVATIVVVYFAYGRRLVKAGDAWAGDRSLILLTLLVAAALPAVTVNPALLSMLVAVSPLCFMAGGTVRAVPAVALILLVPVLVRGLAGEQEWDTVLLTLLVHSAIVGFSLWFGRWIERIVEQSYERAELIRQLRESREEAARLSEEAGAMAERERLAREMHDTLAQGLTSIITLTQAVESEMASDSGLARRHLALMRATASDNLTEARAMVAARQAVSVDGGSLDAALSRLTGRLAEELGIRVELTVRDLPGDLPNDLQICLLRTAQEALANIRRHAGADRADVVLERTADEVVLTVSDDGRGMGGGTESGSGPGNGLGNMRHRADSVGGGLTVDSAPGAGTCVRMTLPLHQIREELTS